jgi:hypothetical protein
LQTSKTQVNDKGLEAERFRAFAFNGEIPVIFLRRARKAAHL